MRWGKVRIAAGQGRPWPCCPLRPHYLADLRHPRRSRVAMLWRSLSLHLTLAALVVMTATELDLATKATFLVTWAMLNFFWLAVLTPALDSRLLSLAMVVTLILLVAVQVRQAHDDGELRRPDDHRSGHIGISLYDHAALARAGSRRRVVRNSVADASLAYRSFPCPHSHRARSAALCAWVPSSSCQWLIPRTFTANFLTGTTYRSLRARAWKRSTSSRRTGFWNRMQSYRSAEGASRGVQSGRKASAHHPAA